MNKAKVSAAVTMMTLIATLGTACVPERSLTFDKLAINCKQLPRSEFEHLLTIEASKAGLDNRAAGDTTKIEFNVDRASTQDALISVYSDRAGPVPLYHGRFLSAVSVFPPSELFSRGGMDNLHFSFFDLKSGSICTQMQDGGGLYWEKNKTLRIEFLSEREIDPDIGTPIGHRVHLD